MSDRQHTPLPWRVNHDGSDACLIEGPRTPVPHHHVYVARAKGGPGRDEMAEANAAFIVKAVNSHDDLLEALKEVTHWADSVIGEPDKAMGVQEYGNKVIKAAVAAIKHVEEATIKHSPSNPCRCKGPSWKPHDADCALWKVEATT